MTMSEIAEATGIHRSTLSKMSNHPGVNVGSDVIDKLCGYFGCQPGDLMTYVAADADVIEDAP
ncbi:MAG TPA: helix-turn-helix transcriptional regulator [Rhodanobacteraceae bacterium]